MVTGQRPMAPRRLVALMRHLPPDSALERSRAGDTGWTQQLELIATQTELLHLMFLATLRIGGVKAKDLPEALHVPRPWDDDPNQAVPTRPERRPATMQEVAAAFGATWTTDSEED